MFEKSSLRTRLSFYLAIKQLGGGSLTLRPEELHLGIGSESIADTSKILSTYGNAFMLRTDSDKKLDQFRKYSSIPIINGLSPSSHPTQVLSDIFTIQEIKKKSISKLKLCWIGDANNNMMNSLIEASIKFSISLNIACPKSYQPNKKLISSIKKQKGKIVVAPLSARGLCKRKRLRCSTLVDSHIAEIACTASTIFRDHHLRCRCHSAKSVTPAACSPSEAVASRWAATALVTDSKAGSRGGTPGEAPGDVLDEAAVT